MQKQFKPTKLLSGGRVTMPQEWLDRNEIEEGDILLIITDGSKLTVSKGKLMPA